MKASIRCVLICSLLAAASLAQTIGPGGGASSGNATKLQGVSVASTAPTANQVLTYNGTAWAPGSGGGGSSVLAAQTSVAAGDTVADSCSGSGCHFASGSYTFAAGTFCPSVGTVYRVLVGGLYTTVASSGAGNVGGVLLLGSTQIASAEMYQSAGLAGLPWSADVWIVCTATGASGAVEVIYTGRAETGSSPNTGASVIMNPANTSTISVDTTASVTIAASAFFNTAAGNSVTEREFILAKE